MTRTSKIFIYICMAGLAAFYACSDKETPQPVVDTARLDALRAELRDLRSQVLGLQSTYSTDSLDEKTLESEIAKLQSVFAKDVEYTVAVTDFQGNFLADATVKLTQNGKVVSSKSDASGLAKFTGIHGGNIAGSVELTGFATLIFTADIADYDAESSYTASSRVSLLPIAGGTAAADKGLFTLNLDLYANYSVQDDTLGGSMTGSDINFALPNGPNNSAPTVKYDKVTDKKVTILLYQPDFDYVPSFGFTTSGVGQILTVSYENAIITATAATNGTYTIKVPASSPQFYFDFNIVYQEFTADYTDYTTGVIKVDKPYDPTITTTKVYRLSSDTDWGANLPGTTLNLKRFYSIYNN